MEKIIKVSGDDVVTGYIRFKKIKPVNGYNEARKRAAAHLSKITKARKTGVNQYAVVVKFYFIIFLIPLLLFLLIWGILQMSTKAVEKEGPEYIPTEVPTIKEAESYLGMYMDIPGFTESKADLENPVLYVYNPDNNECALLYEMYYANNRIGESTMLMPGEEELVNLQNIKSAGTFSIDIVISGFSKDGKKEYNSVSQKIDLIVF